MKEQQSEKLKALLDVAAQVNKALKANGKVYLGSEHKPTNRIVTGVTALDAVLGGGLPCSQVTELFGPESSGKTLLSLLTAASVQKAGGTVVWLMGEGTFDNAWAAKQGVKVNEIVMVEASSGDTMLETALTLLESGSVSLMVIDSLQSLGTRREIEDGVDSEQYAGGGAPQMWGKIMRRAYRAANSGTMEEAAIILISQVRSKIGGFKSHGYATEDGQPSQIRSIKHWKAASVRVVKGEQTWSDGHGKGFLLQQEFKLRCEKNKTAGTLGQTAEFTYVFKSHSNDTGDVVVGLDDVHSVLSLACKFGVVTLKGANYYHKEEKLGLGADSVVCGLRKNAAKVKALRAEVMKAVAAL